MAENVIDQVERLEKAVQRLEKLLDGDQTLGLVGFSTELNKLRQDVDEMRSAKVSLWQWSIGFVLFVMGVILSNHTASAMVGVLPTTGLSLAVVFWGVSAIFFISGLGLIRWR